MTGEPNGPLGEDPVDPAVDGGEGPRRAASARFEVAPRQDAGMRDALDPATQSLGEALKLSYRLLQAGALALVGLFVFSGFQSVQEGSTGVKTLFGAIAGKSGDEQLQPGLQPFWPYPIGDLVVFEQRRQFRMDSEFWPTARRRPDQRPPTLDEQIAAADPNQGLAPGTDGLLLTKDGDIAHAQLEIEYTIADAVRFLECVRPDQSDRVVEVAIRQGAVEAAASLTLAEITDTRDLLGPSIRERAQRVLDRIDSGIELAAVRATERIAPLSVMNRLRDVQAGREQAKKVVEVARQQAATTLTQLAGGEVYVELLALIREYEAALEMGRFDEAEQKMVALGARMEQPDVGGEIARIVLEAKATENSLRARLEREVGRIESLAPSFRDSNTQIVQQLWLGALAEIYSNPQAEVFATPNMLGAINLGVKSSFEVMQDRRNLEIQRQKAMDDARSAGFYAPGLDQMFIGTGGGRRLERDASKGVGR